MVLILVLSKVEYKESLHKTFDLPKYSPLSRGSRASRKNYDPRSYLCGRCSRRVRRERAVVAAPARTGSQPPCSGKFRPSSAYPGARLSRFLPSAYLQCTRGMRINTQREKSVKNLNFPMKSTGEKKTVLVF